MEKNYDFYVLLILLGDIKLMGLFLLIRQCDFLFKSKWNDCTHSNKVIENSSNWKNFFFKLIEALLEFFWFFYPNINKHFTEKYCWIKLANLDVKCTRFWWAKNSTRQHTIANFTIQIKSDVVKYQPIFTALVNSLFMHSTWTVSHVWLSRKQKQI